MLVEPPPQRLLRLAEVAHMMQVHPKTVYYWVRKGRLPALNSPGGLLRVRLEDARALLEIAGVPLPLTLCGVTRRVHVLEPDNLVRRSVARALRSRGFEVHVFDDPYAALLATGKAPPEVFVLSVHAGFDVGRLTAALAQIEGARRTRVVVIGGDAATATATLTGTVGVLTVIPRGNTRALARALK